MSKTTQREEYISKHSKLCQQSNYSPGYYMIKRSTVNGKTIIINVIPIKLDDDISEDNTNAHYSPVSVLGIAVRIADSLFASILGVSDRNSVPIKSQSEKLIDKFGGDYTVDEIIGSKKNHNLGKITHKFKKSVSGNKITELVQLAKDGDKDAQSTLKLLKEGKRLNNKSGQD